MFLIHLLVLYELTYYVRTCVSLPFLKVLRSSLSVLKYNCISSVSRSVFLALLCCQVLCGLFPQWERGAYSIFFSYTGYSCGGRLAATGKRRDIRNLRITQGHSLKEKTRKQQMWRKPLSTS